MKISFRQAALDDVVRQFRFYLIEADVPAVALRFRDSFRHTIELLRQRPFIGPRHRSNDARLQNLRSWPVVGFEAIRIYYSVGGDTLRVIRILHGKRDVARLLARDSIE